IMKNEAKYPIRVVARMTGLSEHVIRIWEKRYQAVVPRRSSNNRRLFSDADIQKLSLLKSAIDKGFSIGQVADKKIDELRQLLGGETADLARSEESLQPTDYLRECIDAVYELNNRKLENSLLAASVALSRPVLIEQLISPFMEEIGRLWQRGAIRIYHEHMASTVIRKFLSDMLGGIHVPANAPTLISTTPAGQAHEFGALLCALTAASQGWDVTYLGPNLPAEEIAAAAVDKNAEVILLSIVYPAGDELLVSELKRLSRLMPQGTIIITGGNAALSYQKSLEQTRSLIFLEISQLREKLQSIHRGMQ
ncbi:MAG: MerR family transcriptional regulator, partial [Calditrichaeota bacterium]